MSDVEFAHWLELFKIQPFDDHARFHRPAALIAASGAKDVSKAYASAIKFLDPPPPDPNLAGYTDAELSTYRAFGITPPPRPAKD